jgi:hypothetical protein
LTSVNGVLWAVGKFSYAGFVTANGVAFWDGEWHRLEGEGLGVYGFVLGFSAYNGGLVTVGGFDQAGDTLANCIASLEGDQWHALGRGLNHWGYAAVPYRGDLVVGGRFTQAGGIPVERVAKWDGAGWSPLGVGLGDTYPGHENSVYALAVYRDSLFAGGLFQGSDGRPLNCVAKWDGTAWVPLGSGMSDVVRAFAVYGGDLIASGYFEFAGGQMVNYIARWDGTGWSSLGSGMDWGVNALVVQGGDLIAAGAFSTAGGVPARRVARWDGEKWSPIGPGVPVPLQVYTVALLEGTLYLGGQQSSVNCARGLARWNGADWVGLGSGVDNDVYALLAFDRSLFVGGQFGRAGNTRSLAVARWDSLPVPVSVSDFEAVSEHDGITLSWVVTGSGQDGGDRITVRRGESPEGPFTDLATLNVEGARSMSYHDAAAVPGRVYWYALVLDTQAGSSVVAGPIRAGSVPGYITHLSPLQDPGGGRPIPIRYTLGGGRGRVRLTIYDVGGRLVRVLQDEVRDPGAHEESWDRATERGGAAARGLYFVRLVAHGTSVTGKLVLLQH